MKLEDAEDFMREVNADTNDGLEIDEADFSQTEITVGHVTKKTDNFKEAYNVVETENFKENPEVAVRVADYFYDEEISTEFFEGRRGEPDEVGEDTQVRQVPCTECDSDTAYMVADPPEGVNTQTFRNKCCPASNFPYFCSTEGYEKYQHLHYTDKKAEKIEAIKKISPDPIGKLNYTEDEAEIVNQVQADIITYANRRAAEWVMNGKIDEEWDSYLQELKNMRLDEMMGVVQAAQDRFEENLG